MIVFPMGKHRMTSSPMYCKRRNPLLGYAETDGPTFACELMSLRKRVFSVNILLKIYAMGHSFPPMFFISCISFPVTGTKYLPLIGGEICVGSQFSVDSDHDHLTLGRMHGGGKLFTTWQPGSREGKRLEYTLHIRPR